MAYTIDVTHDRRAEDVSLWALQWALGAIFFVVGLLKATILPGVLGPVFHLGVGASPGALSGVGWLELMSGVLLVVPSASRFFPWLTPAAASFLFATEAASLSFPGLGVGFGAPGLDATAALACLVVAFGRSIVVPVPSADLVDHRVRDPAEGGPDARHPFRTSGGHSALPLLAADHPHAR